MNPKAKRPQDWIAEERIGALMKTGTMPEDKRASWCHTKRHQVYLDAKNRHPERWSKKTRNWQHIGEVALNRRNISKTTDLKKAG